MISAWSANNKDPIRSQIYLYDLDSSNELDRWDREHLAGKGRWTYYNLPIVRRFVSWAVKNIVGTGFSLNAQTKDTEWNKLREELWYDRSSSAKVFDIRGKYNFRQYCENLLRGKYKDGDRFVLLMSAKSGLAQFKMMEGGMVNNPYQKNYNSKKWQDGVYLSKNERPLFYNFNLDSKRNKKIPADSVLHFVNFEEPGHTRGISQLGTIYADLIDRTDIKYNVKRAIKIASLFAVKVKNSKIGGGLSQLKKINCDGKSTLNAKDLETDLNIQEMDGDGDIEFISDKRPSPEYQSFEETLVREMALGFGLPYELVWKIASVNSANTRVLLTDAQSFINPERQHLIDTFCKPAYIYDTAKLIKEGYLRQPKDPQWWKHDWIAPRDITIDEARIAKIEIEQNKNNMKPLKQIYGGRGKDWEREIDQSFIEKEYIFKKAFALAQKHGVSIDRFIEPTAGAPKIEDDSEIEDNSENSENDEQDNENENEEQNEDK